MYNVIAITFGYIEEQQTSWLIFQSDVLFKTKKDALHSLVNVLYSKYKHESDSDTARKNNYKIHMAKCCQEAWRKNNKLERCPKCDAKYSNFVPEFDIAEWEGMLQSIKDSTIDSFGLWHFEDDDGWSPWEFDFTADPENIFVIPECGKEVLTTALLNIYPELEPEDGDYPNTIAIDFYKGII